MKDFKCVNSIMYDRDNLPRIDSKLNPIKVGYNPKLKERRLYPFINFGFDLKDVRLRYYNNDDLIKESEHFNTSDNYIEEVHNTTFVEKVDEKPYLGDIITDESSNKTFEVCKIQNIGDKWLITKKLFCVYEENGRSKKYKRLVTDNDKEFLITERLVTSGDGRSRMVVTRQSDNTNKIDISEKIIYKYTNYNYFCSYSPFLSELSLYDRNEINFKFTRNSEDLYNRIISREEELIPFSDINRVLTRSNIKAYSIEDSKKVAELIGVDIEDINCLNSARLLNNQLKLNHEEIIFALIKSGVKNDISSILMLSNSILMNKLWLASDNHIISKQTNLISTVDKMKDKIVKFIPTKCYNFFNGINDVIIKNIFNDPTRKHLFTDCIFQYSSKNKSFDNEFWDSLKIEKDKENRLKLLISYCDLCNNNVEFINLFVENEELKPLDSLIKLTKKEISDKISDSVLNSKSIKDESYSVHSYAEYINKRIELFYPTKSIFLRLSNMNDLISDDCIFDSNFNALRKKLIALPEDSGNYFFNLSVLNNKEFNIEKVLVRDYIEENQKIFTNLFKEISDNGKQKIIQFLNLIQRVYSITKDDKFDTIQALIKNNFKSAFDIIKTGENIFNSRMRSSINTSYVYNSAEVKVNKALAMLNKYDFTTSNVGASVIKTKKLEQRNNKLQLLSLPELEILFGDQNITESKHAESILGPAAYLVDVLNLLKQYKVDDLNTLYDKLKERRPDIINIPLNCKNSVTSLPYIDLAIEILENKIIIDNNLKIKNYIKFDTTVNEDILKTNPENCCYEIYDKIEETSINSWRRKPFDIRNEEVRLYCNSLDIKRDLLLESFYMASENYANPYFDVLGLTIQDFNFFPNNIKENSYVFKFINKLILYPDEAAGITQFRVLISDLLDIADIRLETVELLLSSYYVNPVSVNGNINSRHSIHYHGKKELKTAYLEFIKPEHATNFIKRMYQFQRLLKQVNWSVDILDSIILADSRFSSTCDYKNLISNSIMDSSCIEYIGKAKLLQISLNLSDVQVSALFGDLKILDYQNNETFLYRYFIDNDFSEENKELLKVIINGEESTELIKVLDNYKSCSSFMQYLLDVMQFNDKDIKKFLYFFEKKDSDYIINKKGVSNMINIWQLMIVLNLNLEEIIAFCKIMNFSTNIDVSDIRDEIIKIYKIFISQNLNINEVLYLLKHDKKETSEFPNNETLTLLSKNIIIKREELRITSNNANNIKEFITYIVDELIRVSGAELDISEYLITKYELEKQTFIDYVIENDFIESKIIKFYKALRFAQVFQLSKEDINFISDAPIDIFNLPITLVKTVDYDGLKKFISICNAGRFLKEKKNRFELFSVISNNLISELKLEGYTNWGKEMSDWIHNNTLDPNNHEKYNSDLTWLSEIGEISVFFEKNHIIPSEAISFLKWKDVQETELNKISEYAKHKLGKDIYLTKISEGRNKLREKQRDVLVQYILEIEQEKDADERLIKNENDLYSYFLIDTQMSPIVYSSRILQATLAIQLFIQRIQFNLEPGITISKNDEKKWEWMGLYRLWEANRKIFLYPENWLEPELRDNKTPFFKELEKELTSSELTKEVVENSFMNYFSNVEKIANIEFCQMFNEKVGAYSILHVIGRSRFEPREYFYRKFLNEAYWTPWEKIDLELNSEHIAPVVINDRLIMFWLEFFDEAQEPSDKDLTVDTNEDIVKPLRAKKQLRIQICCSEYINEKWIEKKVFNNKILINNVASDRKLDYRFVFQAGDINYLHIIEPSNKTISFIVESFNHIILKQVFESNNSIFNTPQEMRFYAQKARPVSCKEGISLNIASFNGTTLRNKIINSCDDDTTLLYPHQYDEFNCDSPFIVENSKQSILFVPTVRSEKTSSIFNEVIKTPLQIEKKSMSEKHTLDMDSHEFFTDEHSELSFVRNSSTGKRTIYKKGMASSYSGQYLEYKPELKAYLAYHPFMDTLRIALQRYGIDGLLDPLSDKNINSEKEIKKQHVLIEKQGNKQELSNFELNNEIVVNVLNKNKLNNREFSSITEQFEFQTKGAFSLYNWEIFFHVPYIISNRYFLEGNYKEALKWLHYIFDPRVTEGDVPSKFWKFKPFSDYHDTEGIDDMLSDLSMNDDSDPSNIELNDQIEIWSNDPFKPHNIAQMRVSAYMKAVVMKYLDILIALGDNSFSLDSSESINEATLYYILGAQLLGKKPEIIETSILNAKPYSELISDVMGNCIEYFEEAIIKPENAVYLEKFVESNELKIANKPFSSDMSMKGMITSIYGTINKKENVAQQYFGIPKNDKMFGYWDKIADRLFKIRNSLNINGHKRTLDLFAPPLNPKVLAKAAAAGISVNELVIGENGNTTQYRFQALLQRALEICKETKSLGAGLLSALEKRDSELISKLRSKHEIVLIEMLSNIKDRNIEDTIINLEQLDKQRESINFKKIYYKEKKQINKKEKEQLKYMDEGLSLQLSSQAVNFLAGASNMFPDIIAGASGFGGSPHFTIQHGGGKIAHTGEIISSALNTLATISNHKASRAGIIAGYERRKDDWNYQADIAEKELEQIEIKVLSAQIRKELSEQDKKNHLKQIEQFKESYEILSSKFSNEELYLWMIGEISKLYRTAFEMAYKMAKQAEIAYNFELCPNEPKTFINNNHFDANNKGLLAGEKLFLEIKQMEANYIVDNKRKYELTKHISITLLDPIKIIDLRKSGNCQISLPEMLFDMDHPGHCNRRIKSVSITIPCVSGAYASVSANLTLNSSKIKLQDESIHNIDGKILSMSTSSAINDSGMFELNFSDSRYFPFEGAGVNSKWSLTLPDKVRQFDYNTISDVIIHINYTAQDGLNRTKVEKELFDSFNNMITSEEESKKSLRIMFSLRSQFPEVWTKLEKEDAEIQIKKSQLPYFLQNRIIDVNKLVGYKIFDTDNKEFKLEFVCDKDFSSQRCIIRKDEIKKMPKDIVILMEYSAVDKYKPKATNS